MGLATIELLTIRGIWEFAFAAVFPIELLTFCASNETGRS